MVKSKRQYVDGAFGQIHVRVSKPASEKRRPLVCLHMFPQSGRNFENFIEAASADRIVIAPDFPGYGESDAPLQPISAEVYAQTPWEVIDSLGLLDDWGSVDVFGIHAGAKLAVEVVHQRPNDINRIILSSAAVLYPNEIEVLKNSFEPIPLDQDGTKFKKTWDMIVRSLYPKMTLEMCAVAFAEILRSGEKREWGHDAVFLYNFQFPDILKKITHPVLLLNPRDELYEMTSRTLDYLPNAKLIDLPDWAHGFLDVHTKKVTEIIHGWLDESEINMVDKTQRHA